MSNRQQLLQERAARRAEELNRHMLSQGRSKEQLVKKKILIVDDQEMFRNTHLSFFNPDIYEVYLASSGEEALDMIKNRPNVFDTILTDLNMRPGMNGDQFIQICRSIPGYQNKPIVLISAEDPRELHQIANAAGANFYFSKPANPIAVLSFLEPFFYE